MLRARMPHCCPPFRPANRKTRASPSHVADWHRSRGSDRAPPANHRAPLRPRKTSIGKNSSNPAGSRRGRDDSRPPAGREVRLRFPLSSLGGRNRERLGLLRSKSATGAENTEQQAKQCACGPPPENSFAREGKPYWEGPAASGSSAGAVMLSPSFPAAAALVICPAKTFRLASRALRQESESARKRNGWSHPWVAHMGNSICAVPRIVTPWMWK